MSEPAGDKVTFISVPGAYKTGETIVARYEVDSNYETNTRDWVGVFCVGWTSNRDYYTFEWVQKDGARVEESKLVYYVKFSGSRLPPEDGHFYQFCYVTREGVVKGASRPFQFTKTVHGEFIDDLDDLIEVPAEEDSLVFLRTRHEAQLAELQKKVELLAAANANSEASFVTVKTDRDDLQSQVDRLIAELKASRLEVDNLKETVEAKEEQMQRIKEALDETEKQFEASQKEVGLLQMTVVGKEEEIQAALKAKEDTVHELEETTVHVQNIQKEQQEKDKQVQELGIQMSQLAAENETLMKNEQALRSKCNDLEQENRKLLEDKEVMESRFKYKEAEAVQLSDQIQLMKSQIESLEEEMNTLAEDMEKAQEEKKKLVETLQSKEQEVNVAQENLCEVLGNVKEPRDILDQQTPSVVANVDKSALEALQLAYSDVEKRWMHERKYAARLKNKVAEMEERVKRCQEQYETLAAENFELKKELKKSRTPTTDVENGTEATILLMQREFERLELELQEFQLKHDQRISEKNADIQKLREDLDVKQKELDGRRLQEDAMKKSIETQKAEITQLHSAMRDLKQELDKRRQSHKRDAMVAPQPPFNPHYYQPKPTLYPPQVPHTQQPRSSQGKECPVCGTMFPRSMPQKDFENHVNSHF